MRKSACLTTTDYPFMDTRRPIAFTAGLLSLLAIGSTGCMSYWHATGRNLVDGARLERIDSLAARLQLRADTVGARLQLRTDTVAAGMRALTLDVSDVLGMRVVALRDSLLGDYRRTLLREVREDLVGDATTQRMLRMRNALLDDVGERYLMAWRDGMLGPGTQQAMRQLGDEMVTGVALGYRRELFPELMILRDSLRTSLRQERGDIETGARSLIGYAAAVIVGLLVVGAFVFVFKRSQLHRKTLELLTVPIDKIPDQRISDDLTRDIQKDAQRMRLEPHLRGILEKQGINPA
jgi:hypothetical protein